MVPLVKPRLAGCSCATAFSIASARTSASRRRPDEAWAPPARDHRLSEAAPQPASRPRQRPVEGRSTRIVSRVDVDALLEQQSDRCRIGPGRRGRHHQRRPPVRAARPRIRPSREQEAEGFDLTAAAAKPSVGTFSVMSDTA